MSVKIVKPLHSGEVVLFVLVLVVLFSIAIILLRERQTERERGLLCYHCWTAVYVAVCVLCPFLVVM